VARLGLPYESDYSTAEKPVIDTLVNLRNDLAHGAWHLVDEAEYDQFFVWIDKLMGIFCESIENAAIRKDYLRSITALV
jgi:hypothetical protein